MTFPTLPTTLISGRCPSFVSAKDHVRQLVHHLEEYERSTFGELHTRICAALRGSRPAVSLEVWGADGSVRLMMVDGSSRVLSPEEVEKSRS